MLFQIDTGGNLYLFKLHAIMYYDFKKNLPEFSYYVKNIHKSSMPIEMSFRQTKTYT